MEDFLTQLSKTNIFYGLSPKEIEKLLRDKPYQIKEFDRDQYIAWGGDICNDLLIVMNGSVRGEMTDFSDKKLKIEDITGPAPLAVAFLFGRENRFPVDIIANEPVAVMVIPRDVLIYILQNSKAFLKNYLNTISSRTQFLSGKIRFLSFKTIKEKMANFVLTRTANEEHLLVLNQSQTELADFFGVTRPSLSRALSEMEADGILRVQRREITILDRNKLNKLLHN